MTQQGAPILPYLHLCMPQVSPVKVQPQGSRGRPHEGVQAHLPCNAVGANHAPREPRSACQGNGATPDTGCVLMRAANRATCSSGSSGRVTGHAPW